MYKQAFNKNCHCIPLSTLNTTLLLKAERGMQKVEQVFSFQMTILSSFSSLVAEGKNDLEEQFVFLRGAIKQRPEGIKVNAGDRTWSR